MELLAYLIPVQLDGFDSDGELDVLADLAYTYGIRIVRLNLSMPLVA